MTRIRRSIVPAAVLAVFVIGGCASLASRVREPEINLRGVKLGGIGLRGGTVVAELEIKNPNDFDLETRNISYDLKISDRDSTAKETWVDFAKGTFEENVKVNSGRTKIVEIPIEFTYTGVSGALRSIMDRGTFNYRVEGIVSLREPLSRQIPYQHRGNISLQGVR